MRLPVAAMVVGLLGLVGADRYSDHTALMTYVDQGGVSHAVATAADWGRRRGDILEGMQEAMGRLPDRSKLPALDMKVIETEKVGNVARLKITFVAEKTEGGEERVPAYLFLQRSVNLERLLPSVVALHPTSKLGKAEIVGQGQPNRGYAVELAERGYVVLAPDYPSFGEYPCDFKDPRYASGTIKGVFNHMRCVDLLRSLKEVDGERIGVIGHSLGGHNALFLAAFDTRVRAVATSCGWTPFGDYNGGKLTGWTSPRYMPRIRDVYHLDPRQVPFDFQEVLGAVAPRPVFSNSPVHDENFDVGGVKRAVAEARKVYALLGAPDALVVKYPDCGHDFPPEVREEAYRFLDGALKAHQ